MKALSLKPGSKNVHLKDVPEPAISFPSQAKIRVLEVGICGTDREEVGGGRADAPKGENELIIGHEMVGEVVQIGKDVKNVKNGDLVVITVRRGCGICEPCKQDRYDLCETGLYTERGIKGRHGYDAELVVEEEKFLIKVPKSIKHLAVLTEPTTVVEKAIREACQVQSARLPNIHNEKEWIKGKNVLIAGLGPIGLLAGMVLSLRGAKIFGLDIVDPNSARPKIFEQFGGKYIKSSGITIEKFHKICPQIDMIVEAAGIAKLDFDLIHLLGNNGIYVLTGVPGDERPLNVNGGEIMKQLVLKNQVLFGSVNASFEDFHQAVKDLEDANRKWNGTIEKLITSKTPYQDFQKVLFEHNQDEIKSVLVWNK